MPTATAEVLLSVLIVTYKSRDEIRACLDSIPRSLQGRRDQKLTDELSQSMLAGRARPLAVGGW